MKVWEEEHDIKFQAKYGPFTNGMQLREAMKIIRRIFPYIDVQSAKPDNFEFYRQIGLSPAIGTEEAKIAYDKNIKNLKLFFQGKKKRVISNFKKEMNAYAKNREFERAGEMKNRIFALMHINDIALLKNDSSSAYSNFSSLRPSQSTGRDPSGEKIEISSTFRIEAYDIAHMGGKNMVGVMTVIEDGEVAKHEYKKFRIRTQNNTNDTGALSEVLSRRLLHNEWQYPNLIVVDGGAAQINAAKAALVKARAEVPVVSVLKDERHKPKDIEGEQEFAKLYKREIILANSEAHRFAIAYHKNMRGKNFLKLKK
jgi:excinuclease ABC subunit C